MHKKSWLLTIVLCCLLSYAHLHNEALAEVNKTQKSEKLLTKDQQNKRSESKNKQKRKKVTSDTSQREDVITSATVVPDSLKQTYEPKGFTSNTKKEKVLFIMADPREESITNDLGNTAMAFFESHQFEVEKRDLYQLKFDPIMTLATFYHAKDGSGEIPEDVKLEQAYVKKAQHIIFVYPNWYDSPTPLIKGYMERVFSKNFAYRDSDKGLEGLLTDKDIFTIMNAGYLGGGQGYVGDGLGQDDKMWDNYMKAFKVFDDDTAKFWGVQNKGRFVNDQSPKNDSLAYKKELDKVRLSLTKHLTKTYLSHKK
ncbi:NAD(P)H-dependent oxidoreductase [Vagococcus intermedius]|uniref:NAD(P)H-dependent oxidoreductase n=1 Tax=Vagococcus intermedius TaxID=2991418 RepID=A0AAF0CTP4_9ENTE|nr:NAD(P)H-dependent oxidoreductase [Vagococcus intermedius]WEG72547.1 NAD(P)H-dependent oxidoreductase [Vagococcus intermedius]WEG74633.1 NAD(P)H-dependent oxidoreductase [Vagococcus intermedius]